MTTAATLDRWLDGLHAYAAERVIDREIASVANDRFDTFCKARGFDSAELPAAEFGMLRDLYLEDRSSDYDFQCAVRDELESE